MRIFVCVVLVVLLGCKKEEAPSSTSGGPAEKPAAQGGGAASRAERVVDAYHGVVVTGSFEVTLTAGGGPVKVEAPADWLDRVSTVVKDDTLFIGFDPPNVRNAPHIRVSAPGDGVREVTLTGSGDVEVETPLRGPVVTLAVSGSGDIAAPVESERLAATISGSGGVTVTGTAKRLEASVTGSGELDARGLTATDADVSIAGSGDVDVKATGALGCRVTGSGDLRYHGEPASKDCSATGSGTITRGS